MASGKIFAQLMSFPVHLKALEMGMRELIRFMRAFIRGMYRYKSDRQFAKKATAKFTQLDDPKNGRGNLARVCRALAKSSATDIAGHSGSDRQRHGRKN